MEYSLPWSTLSYKCCLSVGKPKRQFKKWKFIYFDWFFLLYYIFTGVRIVHILLHWIIVIFYLYTRLIFKMAILAYPLKKISGWKHIEETISDVTFNIFAPLWFVTHFCLLMSAALFTYLCRFYRQFILVLLTDTGNQVMEDFFGEKRVFQPSKIEFQNSCYWVHIMIILVSSQWILPWSSQKRKIMVVY